MFSGQLTTPDRFSYHTGSMNFSLRHFPQLFHPGEKCKHRCSAVERGGRGRAAPGDTISEGDIPRVTPNRKKCQFTEQTDSLEPVVEYKVREGATISS